jgi:glycosyltransferase involved in cell wall biosynthesis
MRTLVFIPAWNEQESVGDVVLDVRERLPGVDVLVIDDGSTDRTAERARRAGALVAVHPFNQGLGASLHTGYLYAERHDYDFCAHLDADGQHPSAELARLLDAVWSNECDLALGSRYHAPTAEALIEGEDYKPTWTRKLGMVLFRSLLTFTTRHRFTDTTSGFRAANRHGIRLFAARYQPDFAELESLQRAVRHGLQIKELQVRMLPRAAGRSKITPLASAFFIFKGLLVVAMGSLRRRETDLVRRVLHHGEADSEARL